MNRPLPLTPRVSARPSPLAVLRAVATAACVPYLVLKLAWICGSRVGVPPGSPLRTNRTVMVYGNAVTVLMDACVVVLALLLTRPWGRRVPAWLLLLPMWNAVGLLAQIMYGFPVQLLARALGLATPAHASGQPFLDDWVFTVVYTGFIIQGLTLGTLFLRYARDRWGRLWRGPIGAPDRLPPSAAQLAAFRTAGLLTLLPATVHLLWACGLRTGLPSAARGTDFTIVESGYVLFSALTLAGVLLLLRGRYLPLRLPLLLTGIGSAALSCWGAWMLLSTLVTSPSKDHIITPLPIATYSVQMLIGLLLAWALFSFLARRPTPAGTP
ncbi:hypothetical protein [Streptomyces orinoci]|uniref:Aromatic ring-opening dioxygenase LigA n=1 Tax=Streptomyces orinoci TaxID=67339 RepID=A0ABV3JXJ7_STRON|nr:hypothetical protein [Streptomyces orinoci]